MKKFICLPAALVAIATSAVHAAPTGPWPDFGGKPALSEFGVMATAVVVLIVLGLLVLRRRRQASDLSA